MRHAAPRILTATLHASMGWKRGDCRRDMVISEIYEWHIAGVQSGIFILFKVLTDVTGPGSPLITNLTCPAEGSVYLEWTKPEVTSPLGIFYSVFFLKPIVTIFLSDKTGNTKINFQMHAIVNVLLVYCYFVTNLGRCQGDICKYKSISLQGIKLLTLCTKTKKS